MIRKLAVRLIGFLLGCSVPVCFCACTYNVSVAHTEGESSDAIDNNQDAQADVKPTLELPLVGK